MTLLGNATLTTPKVARDVGSLDFKIEVENGLGSCNCRFIVLLITGGDDIAANFY